MWLKLLTVVRELNGIAVVLADHGNADEMFTVKNGKKQVSTAHSLNPVPCAIVDPGYQGEYEMANLSRPRTGQCGRYLVKSFRFRGAQRIRSFFNLFQMNKSRVIIQERIPKVVYQLHIRLNE